MLGDGFPRRHTKPVVQTRHVDDVRRVHHDVDLGREYLLGTRMLTRRMPFLRVRQKHLHQIRAEPFALTDGIVVLPDMSAYPHAVQISPARRYSE